MAVKDWNSNDALVASIEGIPTAEGTTLIPSLNDLFRKVAAAIRGTFYDNAYRFGGTDANVTIQAAGGSAPASPVENQLWIEYTP